MISIKNLNYNEYFYLLNKKLKIDNSCVLISDIKLNATNNYILNRFGLDRDLNNYESSFFKLKIHKDLLLSEVLYILGFEYKNTHTTMITDEFTIGLYENIFDVVCDNASTNYKLFHIS